MSETALRHDLLELTPEALTALANAGFVKRAQKDVAAGLLPRIGTDAEGVVQADFDDGVRTTLPPGRTLRDAACNCSASGMCRHRVMLVLAYQAQHQAPAIPATEAAATPDASPADAGTVWTPAEFGDDALAVSFIPSVREQAAQLAATHPIVTVQAGRDPGLPPSARLPMCSVRFFSRRELAHARCDCKQGSGCAHVVLAVWAFRQAGDRAAAAETIVEVQPPQGSAAAPRERLLQSDAARALCAQIDALALALWQDGTGQPPMALAARFENVRDQARTLGWCWVDDTLGELWQQLQAQHARSSRYDPRRVLHLLAELWARLRAAAHAETPPPDTHPAIPTRQILGVGVQGEVALDHLRLVSLGAQLWSDDQAEGASVLFADPDTQTVTVLERQWPREATVAASSTALLNRRVAGFPLRQLASGQVITKTATRRANGLIDIGTGARQTGVLPLSPKSWDDLGVPLRHTRIATLAAHLRDAPPDFVRPRQATGGSDGALHILGGEPLHVQSCHWDAAAQVLHARLGEAPQDVEEEAKESAKEDAEKEAPAALHLALPHRAITPGAVDALARALAGEWGVLRAVAGQVRLQDGVPRMHPLALLTAQRAVVLQAEAAPPQPLALGGEPDEDDAPSALTALADDTLELLALWLRQGLRHQSGGALARAQTQVAQLDQAGLRQTAKQLRAVLNDLGAAQQPGLVGRLAMLGLGMEGVGQAA